MTNTDIKSLAVKLDLSAYKSQSTNQLSLDNSFDLNDAYRIQEHLVQERIDRGASNIGVKLGFTSVAKMKQMGVSDLIWGRLTSDMLFPNNGEVSKASFIHPRAEPEICFRISQDITEEIPLDDIFNYVDSIAPAIEIIDSRYENFKFTLEDVVADNCSSAGVVIGEWLAPKYAIDRLGIVLQFNGETVAQGSSEAILGDPWKALQAATRLVTAYGASLKKGDIVLAGAATEAVFIQPGMKVRAEVEGLGEVAFNVL